MKKIRTIDPDGNEICKFLGAEQAGLRRKKCITEQKKILVEE